MPSHNYKLVQKKLGVRFKRLGLLKQALTHSSYPQTVNASSISSNERLEFLGDAVLELITRDYLYNKHPHASEGELSELKKAYTNTEALHRLGVRLNIGSFLLMDKGEENTGGRKRSSNIAGAMEAIIGALYIDRGLKYVTTFITRTLLKKKQRKAKDYKSLINQWSMSLQYNVNYEIIKEQGPPHSKIFFVAMHIDGKKVSVGKGNTKKKAEQDAAKNYVKKRTKDFS